MSDFSKVALGIKTFLRDEHLERAIHGALVTLPGIQLLIADDGRSTPHKTAIYENLKRMNHRVMTLPFDSGFGMKSNVIATLNTRPYLLIGSDDFDFTLEAAEGIVKLQEVLDSCPEVHIASGRVYNRPYEFYLEENNGVVTEIPVTPSPGSTVPWHYDVDLTVNYSLIRDGVLDEIRWDDDVKIGGGEHGAFFLDVKQAGFKVVYVPGVNINEQKFPSSQEYRQFRARARSPERPCFERRGIKRYVLGDGRVDYNAVS